MPHPQTRRIKSISNQSVSKRSEGFVQRLYKWQLPKMNLTSRMLSDIEYRRLIAWTPSGTSFRIEDVTRFAASVLPIVFDHCNFQSFVRQLNMYPQLLRCLTLRYGFHKVAKSRDLKVVPNNGTCEFAHTKFIRGRLDLLDQISRQGGDVDYVPPDVVATRLSLMQAQHKENLRKVVASSIYAKQMQLVILQGQVRMLTNALDEMRARQEASEIRLQRVLEFFKHKRRRSPTSSQPTMISRSRQKHSYQKNVRGSRPHLSSGLAVDSQGSFSKVRGPKILSQSSSVVSPTSSDHPGHRSISAITRPPSNGIGPNTQYKPTRVALSEDESCPETMYSTPFFHPSESDTFLMIHPNVGLSAIPNVAYDRDITQCVPDIQLSSLAVKELVSFDGADNFLAI